MLAYALKTSNVNARHHWVALEADARVVHSVGEFLLFPVGTADRNLSSTSLPSWGFVYSLGDPARSTLGYCFDEYVYLCSDPSMRLTLVSGDSDTSSRHHWVAREADARAGHLFGMSLLLCYAFG